MRILKHLGLVIMSFAVLNVSANAASVKLSWTASAAPPCGPVSEYEIYRSPTSGGQVLQTSTLVGGVWTMAGGTKVGSVPAPATTWTDPTVQAGTYWYKITAYARCNSTPESAFSNESKADIPAQVIIVQPSVQQPPQVILQ